MENAKQTYSKLAFALAIILCASTAIQFLFLLFPLAFSASNIFSQNWFMWVSAFVPLYLIGIPLGLFSIRHLPEDTQQQESLSVKDFLSFFAICFPLMYAGNLIGTALSLVLSNGTAENALLNFALDNSFWKMIIASFLSPIIEEYVFRKQIIDHCAQHGERNAILFSSFSFALFHTNLCEPPMIKITGFPFFNRDYLPTIRQELRKHHNKVMHPH